VIEGTVTSKQDEFDILNMTTSPTPCGKDKFFLPASQGEGSGDEIGDLPNFMKDMSLSLERYHNNNTNTNAPNAPTFKFNIPLCFAGGSSRHCRVLPEVNAVAPLQPKRGPLPVPVDFVEPLLTTLCFVECLTRTVPMPSLALIHGLQTISLAILVHVTVTFEYCFVHSLS